MARIPKAVPGLIFRYGYLWLEERRQGRDDPAKDRPACILLQISSQPTSSSQAQNRPSVEPGEVVILPITTQPPSPEMFSVEMTSDDKRRCGLDPESPSWIIVSEYNRDHWPNADIRMVPETGEFAYGVAPPGLMKRIRAKFFQAREEKKALGFKRSP